MTKIEDLVTYDPETGMFKWLDSSRKKNKGWYLPTETWAGDRKHFIRYVQIYRKNYSAHRLAWYLMKGEWPSIIDHINRNALDNSFCNLREATQQENSQNRDCAGVTKNGKKYRARIFINKKNITIGTFKTEEEARTAYLEAKAKYHPFYSGTP